MAKNMRKRKAPSRRSNANGGDDHELGLWIDYELLRKHQSHTSSTILHSASHALDNRYLQLADLALGTKKTKKKAKAAGAEDA